MRDKNNNLTTAWKYYELGRAYNNSLVPNQYTTVNTNIEFFAGNQWLHIPSTPAMSRLAKPVFNIIKRVSELFVASLASSKITVRFEPLSYYDGENLGDPNSNAASYATDEVRNLFEKFKMEYRIRDALFDGVQTGDYCAHFYFDPDKLPYGGAFDNYRGEIEMELVDGINVMFGNPNTTDVQSQPYILIIGRDTVENLKWEAERFRKNKRGGGKAVSKMEQDAIQPDAEWQEQSGIGGKVEIEGDDDKTGKSLFIYMYTKVSKEEVVIDEETGKPKQEPVIGEDGKPVQRVSENGKPLVDEAGEPIYEMQDMKKIVTTVHVTKATRSCNIYEDVDTGLTLYPIAWGNWERQKNQYHGRALVTGIVPNQIFINSMFAMIFRHLQLQGFPLRLYNADLISQISNEVGVDVGVRGLQPGQNLNTVMTVLQPADMSNQIVMCIDKVMEYTRECLGATDAQLGSLPLDNTSALMVLKSSSEVPLENPRSNLYEWTEDCSAICLDMLGTYYGERPIVRRREFRETVKGPDGAPVINPVTGQMEETVNTRQVVEMFDFSQLKHLFLNVSIDVGSTSYYSEIAMVQTLDNLRRDGTLDVIHYLERIPDNLVPRKQDLIEDLKKQIAQQTGQLPETEEDRTAGAPTKPAGPSSVGGGLDKDKKLANLPNSIQSKFDELPNKAKNALVN